MILFQKIPFIFAMSVLVVFSLITIGISSVNGVIPPKPTFTTDRQAVQEGVSGLSFNCIDPKFNNKTRVIFFSNNNPIFDSSTNNTATGVTMKNATFITVLPAFYSKSGIINAYCSMNGTASSVVKIIPYISKVALTLNPKTFKVGTPFNVTCAVTVLPPGVDYNVTFQRSGSVFGSWSRPKIPGAWTWKNGTAISGASIVANKPPLPFSVLVSPQKKDAAGRYLCSAVVRVGDLGKSITYKSISVSNGGVASLISPISTAIFALFAIFAAVKNVNF